MEPQFKKLSDCPENLRESIDWLIQVRYGNGDNKGLTKLSQALKKLIEEAIEKAKTSLEAERKKLECPVKYKGDESTCQAMTRQIEDVEERLKKLEEGQQKDSNYNKQKKSLDKNKKQCQRFKDECQKSHYLKTAKPQALLDIESKLDQVKKLGESLNGLTDEKQCKKLLDNLCDGLETFLGFNSASKGYDGTGIVYSDLDRLCDGVMGFLSGVLSAVKDDDAVTTYDNNNELNDILTNLQNSIGKGFTVFSSQITQVSQWLHRYEMQFGEKTGAVTSKLDEIGSNIAGRYINDVSGAATQELEKQLEEWTNMLLRIFEEVTKIQTDQINILDITLRNDVIHEFRPVLSAVKLLGDSSKETPFVDQVKEVDKELVRHKEEIVKSIKTEVNTVQILVRDRCAQIFKQFSEYDKKQNEHFVHIRYALNESRRLTTECFSNFDLTYRNGIAAHFDNIKNYIEQLTKDESTLKRSFTTVQGKVADLEYNVKQGLSALKKRINEQLVQYATIYITKARKHFNSIKTGIGDKVVDKKNGIDHHWDDHKNTVSDYVKNIYDKEGKSGKENNLGAIINGVKFYADKFTKQNFEEKVDEWITDILKTNEIIKKNLTSYINFCTRTTPPRDKFRPEEVEAFVRGGNQALHEAIKKAIKEQIKDNVINEAADTFDTVVSNDIKTNLEKVKSVCFEFATILEQEINKTTDEFVSATPTGLSAFATKISKTTDELLRQKGEIIPPTNSVYDLNFAVRYIIVGLSAASRQVYDELESFTDERTIALSQKIEAAIKGVRSIETSISSNGIDLLLTEVKKNIGQLDTALKTEKTFTGDLVDKVENVFGTNEWKFEFTLGNNLMKEFHASEQALRNAILIINDQLEALKAVPNYVDMQNDGAGNLMVQLESDIHRIHKQINQIELAVTGADDALKNAIKHVGSAVVDAEELVNQYISQLQNRLIEAAETAFRAVTTEVRLLFTEAKKADLRSLRKVVKKQLALIEAVIAKDQVTGVKGFIKTLKDGTTKNLGSMQGKNIDRLKILGDHSSQQRYDRRRFSDLADAFYDFCQPLHNYLLEEITRANQNTSGPAPNYTARLKSIFTAFDTLLPHLKEQNRYDHRVPSMLSNLRDAVKALKPDGFSTPSSSTLDCITSGLTKFADELDKAYISVYDGQRFESKVVEETGVQVVYTSGVYPIYSSTDYGRKCAKAFCTALEILFHDLSELRAECKRDWKHLTICINLEDNIENDLGVFLKGCGYGVRSKAGVQDAELRWKEGWTGQQIHETLLTKVHDATLRRTAFTLVSDDDEKKDEASVPTHSVLKQLLNYLTRYYEVCHYDAATSTKYPSSIYQMLTWLSGLPHSTVYLDLTADGFGGLFEKKEEASESIDSDGPLVSHFDEVSLPSYPRDITVTTLSSTLAEVCSGAHDVLTSVLGHGHAGGRYACDFNTNPDKFSYPADMVTLACWLYDILKRVHHQLYFLYQQCYQNTERNGWAECYYGRYVAGSSWQCNKMQCPDQTCEQKCKQTCNQMHNEKGDQHANCGLKSPLQSFLEDGLQGFLPHHVKCEKGKLECSVKGHSSLPCKTPMGFGNISDVASHTQRGRHIYEALKRLCGDERSPLPKLCGQLSCLLPSAPKSLDDMFGFYYRLLRGWNNPNDKRQQHRETALEGAVKDANFGNEETKLDITTVFKKNDHGSKENMTHLTGDLYALIDCNGMSSSAPSHPCGRYMRPICHDMCGTFTKENADKYLSWIVYCTGSFLDLLKQLYEECNGNCASDRPKCRISKCKKGCKALESPMAPGSAHDDSCKSIVDCTFMRPTFYKYGLVLGDCKSLSAKSTKRTCKDLCMVLKSVTNEIEVDGHPLAKLVHVTIPEFLLKIRAPFIWLNVALWILSLLYLLHIMVIRLDLLHIKSHLHSPSSHRIAAQSLLAAARVNKLGKVFYLQP